jgi:hypothetical protein
MKIIAACILLTGAVMGLLPQNVVASNVAYFVVGEDYKMGRSDPEFWI